MLAAPDPQGWDMRPKDKFHWEFHREVLDPNIRMSPQSPHCQTVDDVWSTLEGNSAETDSSLTVEEHGARMILRFCAQFDSMNPETKKGKIDGEEFIIENRGDIVEMLLPGSICSRTLHSLRAGDKDWADINIAPNMVFFESVPNKLLGKFWFQIEAIYQVE